MLDERLNHWLVRGIEGGIQRVLENEDEFTKDDRLEIMYWIEDIMVSGEVNRKPIRYTLTTVLWELIENIDMGTIADHDKLKLAELIRLLR